MPSTPAASARRASSAIASMEPRSRHGWPTISPTYGKKRMPRALDDLLHGLDQRAADEVVGPHVGGHPRRLQRVLLGLGDDLEVRDVPVAADVGHQLAQLLARQPDVLAADVPHAGVRDRRVDLARVRERRVVAREHEDELRHRCLPIRFAAGACAGRRAYSTLRGESCLTTPGVGDGDARSDLAGAGRDGPGRGPRRHLPGRRRAAAGARLRHLRHRRAHVLQRRPPDRGAVGARARDHRRDPRARPRRAGRRGPAGRRRRALHLDALLRALPPVPLGQRAHLPATASSWASTTPAPTRSSWRSPPSR